jgi:hypothetical protein
LIEATISITPRRGLYIESSDQYAAEGDIDMELCEAISILDCDVAIASLTNCLYQTIVESTLPHPVEVLVVDRGQLAVGPK